MVQPKKDEAPIIVCHRMYVPSAVPVPSAINPNEVRLQANISTSPCLGAKCMMWNPERSECFDKTQARALSRIADNYTAPQEA